MRRATGPGSRVRPAAARSARRLLRALRRERRVAAAKAVRLSGACMAAYLVAQALLPHGDPVLAPLTALLVVQVTLRSTLTSGLQRVLSVVAGVGVSTGLSSAVGFTWWSLGLLIAATVVLGQLLRLGDHLLEVPISAMLVLAVGGSTSSYAVGRVVETVLGAAVGVAVNLLFPPGLRPGDAGAAVEHAAAEMARLLERAAGGLREGAGSEQAEQWLVEARGLPRSVAEADRALREAVDRRQLNPRAAFIPDATGLLRSGLDALEVAAAALRTLFAAMADGLREPGGEDAAELRDAFAVLLDELAAAVRGFGELVHAEGRGATEPPERELAAALEALREARARLTELLLLDAGEDRALWQLHGALLAAVERLLRALDVEHRGRQREEWAERTRRPVLEAVRERAERDRGEREVWHRLPPEGGR